MAYLTGSQLFLRLLSCDSLNIMVCDQVKEHQWSGCSEAIKHCLISYRGGLGTSLCIMGYETQHPHSRKEHIELYNILKFGVNQANIRRDTAIQRLKNLLRMYGTPDTRPASHTFLSKIWSF